MNISTNFFITNFFVCSSVRINLLASLAHTCDKLETTDLLTAAVSLKRLDLRSTRLPAETLLEYIDVQVNMSLGIGRTHCKASKEISAPIVAWMCNFPPTDRTTNRQTDRRGHWEETVCSTTLVTVKKNGLYAVANRSNIIFFYFEMKNKNVN